MKHWIDFKIFLKEYQELIDRGKTFEDAIEILTELYGKKDGEADDDECE